ncbi:MAG: hypothetical protein ACLRFP_05340, partial [Alphaproteobacteria bacterium]
WAVTFSYGTVKGMAKCSSTNGGSTPSDTNGQYCWCQATNYTPNEGNQCNVASPSWGPPNGFGSGSNCANSCAHSCAIYVVDYATFRRALFGVTQ